MGKKIMMLGAGHFMVPAVKCVRNMGIEALVIDRNPAAEGFKFATYSEIIDIVDIENALKIAKKYDIDGIIPLNDFGVVTASYISEAMGLVGLNPEVAKTSVDKRSMRMNWDKNGLPCPKFKIVRSFDEASEAVEEIGFPVIAKPPDTMGGSRGVYRINNMKDLQDGYPIAMENSKCGELLIEEYVVGDECSVESITYKGVTHVLGISDKTKLDPPYRVDKGLTYPSKYSLTMKKEIIDVTKKAVESIGIENGPTHLELSITKKGIKLFEIGARTGAGGTIASVIVPAAYGIDMMKEIIKISLGEKLDIITPGITGGSVFRFLTPTPGKILGISGLERAFNLYGVVSGACFVKVGDIVSPVKSGSDRAGYIITKGKDRQEAIKIADMVEDMIEFNVV